MRCETIVAWQALQAHDKTLQFRDSAVEAEKLPVFLAFGDFGGNMVAPDPSGAGGISHSFTYDAGLELKIPVLDGHRRAIEHSAILSESLQQQNVERDIRRQIELQTRLAFASLQEAEDQLALAKQNLEQAGRRPDAKPNRNMLRARSADLICGRLKTVTRLRKTAEAKHFISRPRLVYRLRRR